MPNTAGSFVHLHNHTEYSFLDGAIKIKQMVDKAIKHGSPALAITDHGGLFGALEFYNCCRAKSIEPILGFEAYITHGSRHEKDTNRNHIILLAETQEGWENIIKLSSIGYLEGFYYKPRIDLEVLRAHSKGIIATSACIAGAVPRALLKGDRAEAIRITDEYLSIFGENNFYYEIQNHGMDDEHIAYEQLIDLAKEKSIPLVLANDAHYLNADDAEAHEVLLCMQTNGKLSDPNRFRFPSDQFYLKSPEEMRLLFPDQPEAFSNTLEIARRCTGNIDPKHKAQMPNPGVPEGYIDEAGYLRALAEEGALAFYGNPLPEAARERLEYELSVIIEMGFPGYYLIVRDFLKKADEKGIFRGVRGSAAGSFVGFSIGISNVDPLKFDLIFERFLNPERKSMPDVDADFADANREEIIDYCVEKYGRESVCQIINFGRMMAKAAVKDVARVLEVSVAESQRLSNMLTEKTIGESIEKNSELKALLESNTQYHTVFNYAQKLEGMARQPGMHAAGVIIAPSPVQNWAPLYKPSGDTAPIMTQFDMKYIEETGMVKMDFLGLRTLTVQQNTVRMIQEHHNVSIDLWKDIQDEDSKTYSEIFHTGNTVEIFQFESEGMRKHLRKLKATTIEDLIAMTSLYRPGPMKNIDSFIHRKHGKEPIVYPHPILKDILDVTYGIIVYQEQVMRIARDMGGFTMGQADNLRKAMGKKDDKIFAQMKKQFMIGSAEKDIEPKKAEDVWNLMVEFAKYGFNKAHACVYAHVSYQSAYLKAHYPIEYMAAVISSRMGENDRFVSATEEAKRMGITILPPDVNTSKFDCNVHEGSITIGLGAVSSVGRAAHAIIETREKRKVPFSDIFDLCTNINTREVSKKSLEALVWAGALDSLPGNRAQKCAAIDTAIDFGKKQQQDSATGQTSLFGGSETLSLPTPELSILPEWDFFDKIRKEKAVLNFYVSGHPLDLYRDEVEGFSTLHFRANDIQKVKPKSSVIVGGFITSIKKAHARSDGRPMAFLKIEDFYGSGEIIVWPDKYPLFSEHCDVEKMVLVRGTVEKEVKHSNDHSGGATEEAHLECKIIADKIIALADVREILTKSIHIEIATEGLEEEHLQKITEICSQHKGDAELVIHLITQHKNEYMLHAPSFSIKSTKETICTLRELPGIDSVKLSQHSAKYFRRMM